MKCENCDGSGWLYAHRGDAHGHFCGCEECPVCEGKGTIELPDPDDSDDDEDQLVDVCVECGVQYVVAVGHTCPQFFK